MAMETRFRWPPEMPLRSGVPTRSFMTLQSFRSAATWSTHFRISSLDVPEGSRKAAWKRMFSPAVSSPWSTSSCGTKPVTCCKKRKSSAFRPPTSNCPSTVPYEARPLSTASKVDFPLPDGPMTAMHRPGEMARLISFSKRFPSGRSKHTDSKRKETPVVPCDATVDAPGEDELSGPWSAVAAGAEKRRGLRVKGSLAAIQPTTPSPAWPGSPASISAAAKPPPLCARALGPCHRVIKGGETLRCCRCSSHAHERSKPTTVMPRKTTHHVTMVGS
mmetsp:Transcript_6588/g.14307  ORF Transcript_6588/g.14307 Transcript_6588/m.14307 type:complete len:275 (-) Transcript_6588:545-1369(-)